MSQENLEVVRRAFARAATGDWEGVFELYDEAVEFRSLRPIPTGPEVLHGREAVRLLVAQWRETFDEFGADVCEYVDAYPWVICDTRWHGKAKGSGIPIGNRVADAYEVKGGKIVRAIMSYPDVATALSDLGLEE